MTLLRSWTPDSNIALAPSRWFHNTMVIIGNWDHLHLRKIKYTNGLKSKLFKCCHFSCRVSTSGRLKRPSPERENQSLNLQALHKWRYHSGSGLSSCRNAIYTVWVVLYENWILKVTLPEKSVWDWSFLNFFFERKDMCVTDFRELSPLFVRNVRKAPNRGLESSLLPLTRRKTFQTLNEKHIPCSACPKYWFPQHVLQKRKPLMKNLPVLYAQ